MSEEGDCDLLVEVEPVRYELQMDKYNKVWCSVQRAVSGVQGAACIACAAWKLLAVIQRAVSSMK